MPVEGQLAREVVEASRDLTRAVRDIKRNVRLPIDLEVLAAIRRYINTQLGFLRSLRSQGADTTSELETGDTLLGLIAAYEVAATHYFGYEAQKAREQRPTNKVAKDITVVSKAAEALRSAITDYLHSLQKFFHNLLEGVE